jgi:perosamine synthetase
MSTGRRIPFFKGRVALHAILEAAGIGEGDQVLLPGYTCIVVPNAILYRGAEPVYVDIDPATLNLDAGQLESSRGTAWSPSRARAVIIQHTFGLPTDIDRIVDFARRNGLLVIEDACHALGSTWHGRPVGTLGDAAFFSSQWSKPVTTGLGGWAEVNNPELAAAVSAVAARYPAPGPLAGLRLQTQYLAYRALYRPRLFWALQGLYRTLGRAGLVIGSSTGAELDCRIPGDYRRRMGPLQERTLCRLLVDADRAAAVRGRHAAIVERELDRHGLPHAHAPDGADPVWLRYPLRVGNKDALLASARTARIELGDWFLSPVHPNLTGWEQAAYRAGSCPEAERASRQVINLPTHAHLDEAEIARIVAFVAAHAVRV